LLLTEECQIFVAQATSILIKKVNSATRNLKLKSTKQQKYHTGELGKSETVASGRRRFTSLRFTKILLTYQCFE